MQKPVCAPFRERQKPPVGVQHPKKGDSPLFLRKKGTVPFFQVGGRERVAMNGAAGTFRGQGHRRHIREEIVERDQGGCSLGLDAIQRQGPFNGEVSDARPSKRLQMRSAPERLTDVVREGAHVEAGGRGHA